MSPSTKLTLSPNDDRFSSSTEFDHGIGDKLQAIIPLDPAGVVHAALRSRATKRDFESRPNQSTFEEEGRILDLPTINRTQLARRAEFSALQEWEGYVEEIRGDIFIGRLLDLTAEDTHESESVEVALEDLSEGDRNLVRNGAIFRWVIGYEQRGGTRRRVSEIVFRRLPVWTEEELEAARVEAREIASKLNSEEGRSRDEQSTPDGSGGDNALWTRLRRMCGRAFGRK